MNRGGRSTDTSDYNSSVERTRFSRRVSAFPHPYPFVAVVITVTALVAANPDEGIRLANLTAPVVVGVLLALAGWAIGALVATDRERQSAIALLVSLPLLTSGYIFGWIRSNVSAGIPSDSAETGLSLVLIVGAVWGVRRLPPLVPTVSRFLNILMAVLFLFTVPAVLRLLQTPVTEIPSPVALQIGESATRPDIYLFVLDAYSGSESLQENYGFDNLPMLDSLRLRGFRFPDRPRANYIKTFLSVGSMLNRRYADDLVQLSAPDFTDRRPAYKALEFNQTIIDLKHMGYEFVYVGSSYPPMADNRLSDTRNGSRISHEFESAWTRLTIVDPAIRVYCAVLSCKQSGMPFAAENAAATELQFRILKSAVSRPGPKFVYAHLLLPHGPFRFGPACEHRLSAWTTGSNAVTDSTAKRLFIDQVECTNRKLLELVDAIHEGSGDSAVILLQADHGHGRFAGGMPPELEAATADQVRERFDVFSAYAGPGYVADSLAAYRTPVNLFRTLFRVLWGADEPPLEDRHYWSGTRRSMLLTEVALD